MHVETRWARAWGADLAPTRFRKLALASALALYVIVASGTLVRLTGSGLGCESWPGCSAGSPFPQEDYHAFVEFGNRVFGIFPIALSALTWLGARRVGLPAWAARLALAVALVALAEAPIGLATIYYDLHPLIVVAHFLLALLALGGAVVVALEAHGLDRVRPRSLVPPELRRAGLVLAFAGLALVVTGALATAAGPHSGDAEEVDRFGTLATALWVHVRTTALFGCVFLFVLGYLAARRRVWPRLFRFALALLGLVLAQMAVGELQWRLELPWGIVLVHVALAAGVWAATIGLVTMLWRPLPWLVPSSGPGRPA